MSLRTSDKVKLEDGNGNKRMIDKVPKDPHDPFWRIIGTLVGAIVIYITLVSGCGGWV